MAKGVGAMIGMATLRPAWYLTALATLLGGCVSHDEVSRVRSPSGRIDAVVVERNGGATTSFRYDVYIVKEGKKPSEENRVAVLDGATRSENAYGVNLVWRGPTFLMIEFMTAKNVEVEKATLAIDGDHVVVAVQEGVKDPLAPAGGMLYNLRQNGPSK